MGRLAEKVAFITGAGSGIARAAAHLCGEGRDLSLVGGPTPMRELDG